MPEPPVVVRVSGVPKVPVVDVIVKADWLAMAKVMLVADEETWL